MADSAHLKILREGVAQWNAWREANPDVRPDLTESNLQRYPLAGANFANADLSAANLMHADLSRSVLDGADLVNTAVCD